MTAKFRRQCPPCRTGYHKECWNLADDGRVKMCECEEEGCEGGWKSVAVLMGRPTKWMDET